MTTPTGPRVAHTPGDLEVGQTIIRRWRGLTPEFGVAELLRTEQDLADAWGHPGAVAHRPEVIILTDPPCPICNHRAHGADCLVPLNTGTFCVCPIRTTGAPGYLASIPVDNPQVGDRIRFGGPPATTPPLHRDPAPNLVTKPVAQIITFWAPGSHGPDWTWADEYNDLTSTRICACCGEPGHYQTALAERVKTDGIGFHDHLVPVLLGNDGRVWDGHHRICLAIQLGIPTLEVEVAGP